VRSFRSLRSRLGPAPLPGAFRSADSAASVNTLAQLHACLFVGVIDHATAYQIASLVLGEIFIQTRGNQLFDAQPHLPFFTVDGHHLALHRLAATTTILRMVDPR